MGSLMSRPTPSDDNLDVCSNYTYKYPPRTGNYFANYFMMGEEKFEIQQPESYLFGENLDLNFLGDCPGSFPYPPPEAGEPSRAIRCVVNVRRESVRFVKATNEGKESYRIEFIFDTDVRCSITIYYFCTEQITSCGINYISKDPSLNSDVYYYKRGINQQFVQPNHFFDPSLYDDEDLVYNAEKNVFPIIIHCVALEPVDESHQSHTTIMVVDHHADGTYTLKTLKQKLFIDGLCYLLQEIYGIENKNNEIRKEISEDELDDGGLECVICMSEIRDTLILPCKHLCLCQACADSLRYQASCCPICRSPFRALLQIKTVQKSLIQRSNSNPSSSQMNEAVNSGYSCVPLIEALNGPIFTRKFSVMEPLPDDENSVSKKCSGERHAKSIKTKGNCVCRQEARDKSAEQQQQQQQELSNSSSQLSSGNTDGDEHKNTTTFKPHNGKCKLHDNKDTIHIVNEMTDAERETIDEDSDTEKLSPLLETNNSRIMISSIGSVQVETVDSNKVYGNFDNAQISSTGIDIDNDNDTNSISNSSNIQHQPHTTDYGNQNSSPCIHNNKDGTTSSRTADDSDYYTPEESSTSILTSLHADKDRNSLPGTPASLASLRSSADSYTSTCSSRMLLTSSQDKSTAV